MLTLPTAYLFYRLGRRLLQVGGKVQIVKELLSRLRVFRIARWKFRVS